MALEKICREGDFLVLVEPSVLDPYFTWYLWLLRRSVRKVIFLFLLNRLFLILTLPGTVLVALEKICWEGDLLVLVEPSVLDPYFTWYLWFFTVEDLLGR